MKNQYDRTCNPGMKVVGVLEVGRTSFYYQGAPNSHQMSVVATGIEDSWLHLLHAPAMEPEDFLETLGKSPFQFSVSLECGDSGDGFLVSQVWECPELLDFEAAHFFNVGDSPRRVRLLVDAHNWRAVRQLP